MEEIHRNSELVKEYFENLDSFQLMEYYNEYADKHSYERIYENNDDFLEQSFSSMSEAIRAVLYGDYTYNDDYVQINGLGNLDTTDDLTDFIDIEELVNDAMDDPDTYEIEFIDPNDLDDEELFNYLQEYDCSGDIKTSDLYSPEEWPRERLEEIGNDNDLI